ncbi:NAD-dependent epimerase/dehydratase family protein [Cognataquiflexum aquatile]|uniref:NAD-dependent epimerase/dehydratase family protein n=1 Tax=Cognataquiflexum aquatile TaxID=2249427 RepID=UPI000DEBEE0D|nr:NAD(P)-dependent oxidoreductase [Cognataquiflexum aquatile]
MALNQYDLLIHLVSLDHRRSNGFPHAVSAENVTPVWSLLDIFSKKGLKKFIYFSTTQVYGNIQNEIISEHRNPKTNNAYALTHHVGEVICEYYNRNYSVDCHVVRLSNNYGAPILEKNNSWWLIVNDLCRMAFIHKELVLTSDGSPIRDFIHGWDVCYGVQLIIESSSKHGIFNLCSGITLSIKEVAEKIKTVFYNRYGLELIISAGEQRPHFEIRKFVLDNSLIRSLGFETKWSLEVGINELFDYLEQNNA